jgi:hypothetical protein
MTLNSSKTIIFIAFSFLINCLIMTNSASAQGRVKLNATQSNTEGGVTTTRGAAAKGKNGGGFAHARATTTNGQGQAAGGGAAAVKGPNGGKAGRVGKFSADDAGNVNYQGAAATTGANGSAATAGGFSRSPSGGIAGSRSTAATANNGSTYDGNTSYQSGVGVTHTQQCHDASGQVISCPNDSND